MRKKLLFSLLAVFIAFCFGWFVWPTKYEYRTVKWDTRSYTLRINRFTDRTEIFTTSGWTIFLAVLPSFDVFDMKPLRYPFDPFDVIAPKSVRESDIDSAFILDSLTQSKE